jgi:hypothetical protein
MFQISAQNFAFSYTQLYAYFIPVFGSMLGISTFVITCLMPFVQPFMTGSSKSGQNNVAGKSAFPTLVLPCISPSAQPSSAFH